MFAQMKHLAIVSSNVNLEGDFYRDVLKLKRSGQARAGGAVVLRDGYVGINVNPRAPGRQAGFDHFGFEVQDVELVFSRLKSPCWNCFKQLANAGVVRIVYGEFYRDERIFDVAKQIGIELLHQPLNK